MRDPLAASTAGRFDPQASQRRRKSFFNQNRPKGGIVNVTDSSRPLRVLFLCTHNSARSQMAEAWLRYLGGDRFEVASAGTEATTVRPLAIVAMREVGIDIAEQTSKALDCYLGQPWDAVITVCDQANDVCPVFPGGQRRLHWSFPDPSRSTGSESERLASYREVREGLRVRVEAFLTESLAATAPRPGMADR
jgi:arsenate reductase